MGVMEGNRGGRKMSDELQFVVTLAGETSDKLKFVGHSRAGPTQTGGRGREQEHEGDYEWNQTEGAEKCPTNFSLS